MRKVEEWVGLNDSSPIPPRVKLRIFRAAGGMCAICEQAVATAHYDHITALCNGGSNRESNMQLLHVRCHAQKTKADLAQKKKDNRVMSKHVGIKKPGRPMPGSRASGLRKRMDGTVERRS
jgi:5-methylcytosine-specific restriction protein A